MLISALCIPEKGPGHHRPPPQHHARDYPVSAHSNDKNQIPLDFQQTSIDPRQRTMGSPATMSTYPYSDREPDFGHDSSPQYTCSADSPNAKPFGRAFSKSTTPGVELSCRMRSAMRLKRSTSDSEEDEEQEDGTGKKARLSDDPASPVVVEFACPFYKRNRHKYCHQRSCRTSGWPSVHRVK